jgi:Flp pilus assembly protein TadG
VSRRRAQRDDRGSITVELVVLAPVFALLLVFVVSVGRIQAGRADVEGAARSAARTITLSRHPHAAAQTARAAAASTLEVGSPTCQSMRWDAQVDEAAATVSISCNVSLSHAGLLPLPGSYTVSATSTEVLDRHREREGAP